MQMICTDYSCRVAKYPGNQALQLFIQWVVTRENKCRPPGVAELQNGSTGSTNERVEREQLLSIEFGFNQLTVNETHQFKGPVFR